MAVFHSIDEYEAILRNDWDKTDPEYWVHLHKANQRYRAAVRSAAERLGLDLVFEKGSIRVKADAQRVTLYDLTPDVIEEIRR